MANIITGIRILCSIALLFFPVFSPAFYSIYLIAGVSDMIDGTVARKTGTVSAFGSKLDTAADFALVTVCLIKMIPVIHVPRWLMIWIIVIAAIKAINLISGYVMRKELVVLHTGMNKMTGILLFALPLTFSFIDLKYSGAFVWFARIIEWEFPGFSVERCFDRLLRMQEIRSTRGRRTRRSS